MTTQLDRIEGMLKVIFDQAQAGPAPASSVPKLIGPGSIDLPGAPGVKANVVEPIAADWVPSLMGGILNVSEPSNGDGSKDFPRRSVSGYPWQYGKGEGGKLIKPGRIVYGDWTFANEAEIAANREASEVRRRNIDAYMERLNNAPIDGLSNINVHDVLQDPHALALMRHFDDNARHRFEAAGKAKPVDIFRILLDGSHVNMNRAINASYFDSKSQAIQQTWANNPAKLTAYLASTPWSGLVKAYNSWISEATQA